MLRVNLARGPKKEQTNKKEETALHSIFQAVLSQLSFSVVQKNAN